MRTTGCSWALKGLGLLGLFSPEVAWAECTEVHIGTSLADALGFGSTGDSAITISGSPNLCFEEGWVDPDRPDCLTLLPGSEVTISVIGGEDASSIPLPGFRLEGGGSPKSSVNLTNVDIVGECYGAEEARLLVEGDHLVTLKNVTLAGGDHYGLFAKDGTISVSFSEGKQTTAFGDGFSGKPVVKLASGAAEYTQSYGAFSNNHGASALVSYGATVKLYYVAFSGNQGGTDTGDGLGSKGGALFVRDGMVMIIGGNFTENDAAYGGAIWGDTSAWLMLSGVAFSENVATKDGGAVAMSSIDTITLNGGTSFTGDNAMSGGAIAVSDSSRLIVEDVSFTSTWATGSGGAIYSGVGVSVIGNTNGAPSFVSTSAAAGGAVAFVNASFFSTVNGASFEDIQGSYAIDVSGTTSERVDLVGLTSPNGLGQRGLLRVHTGGSVQMSDSTITGLNRSGSPTALEKQAGLIEVVDGRLDLFESVLCGFIADVKGQPLIKLEALGGSATIRGSTLMNLDGVGDGQGLIHLNTLQTVYLYNNTVVGALGGAQSAVYAEQVGGLIGFNNIFHQLGSGIFVNYSTGLEVMNNLYSPSVGEPVEYPSGSYSMDAKSFDDADPLFVAAFDPTRCSVWPYLTEGSPADGVGMLYTKTGQGLGDESRIGAWGVLLEGELAAVDTDEDKYSILNDCDDANANISPGAPEVAGNGVDDDCDGEVDEVTEDTGDTGLELGPDTDGDGVPDVDDCAPNDDQLAVDCPSRFVYRGGRLDCATTSPADLSALGLLVVAFAGTRRRRPPGLV